MSAPPRLHPSLVLGAYAERLVSGARVALFGDASTELAGALLDRGARLVHVYDADRVRSLEAAARTSRRSLVHAALPDDGDLGVRDGAFDVVIVPDLTAVPQPTALLALARRVLSPAGAALVASPNADATRRMLADPAGRAPLGYYELYDALALQFRRVRMLGQQPFVAYAIAELAPDEEPEVAIDTSLVTDEPREPEWFIAIASDRDARLEPYALVQVPLAWVPEGEGAAAPQPTAAPEDERARALADQERERALAQARDADRKLEEERRRAERLSQEIAVKAEEVLLARARAESVVEELERARELRLERDREIATLEERATTLRQELEQARASAHETRRELAQAREHAERGRGADETLARRLTVVEHERDRARGERDAAQRDLAAAREELEAARRAQPARAAELQGARDAADGARAELKTARDAAEAARREAEALRGELRVARDELQAARAELASARAESIDLRTQLAAPRHDPEVARLREELARRDARDARDAGADAERVAEVEAYERRLAEQARRIAELAADAAERTRVGRELLGLLEEARTAGASAAPEPPPAASSATGDALVADLEVRLDRLAADAARREADLTAARWTIAQLEQRLARQGDGVGA